MLEVILKRFEKPDEFGLRKDKVELVHIGGMTHARPRHLCARMEVVRARWPLARQEELRSGRVGWLFPDGQQLHGGRHR